MAFQDEIRQLATLDSGGAPILSVYLDLDPARQARRSHRVAFQEFLKVLTTETPEPARVALAMEGKRVEAWLEAQPPEGQGIALFASAPRDLWHVRTLATRVADHVVFETSPDLGPLLEMVDEHERYAVALVDKVHARVMSVFAGEIEESTSLADDDVPRKHEQGGWSQANFQRHHDEHVHLHLKRVVEQAADLVRRRRIDRLIIGGAEEAASELRRLLPKELAERLAGEIPVTPATGDAAVLERVRDVEEQVEREAEARLLTSLFEAAAPRAARAALGLAATLDALWAQAAQHVVVAEGLHEPGSECPGCGRLARGRVDTCSGCGRTMHPLHDVIHRAMTRAVTLDAGVDVVRGAAAERLREVGGAAALLRYASPAATTQVA